VSSRVEQWLHGSERTPDRTVDERVAELLEAVRRGAERDAGESWDAANERHAEEFIVRLCARFPGRGFEVCWPPAHDQPEKMLLQSMAYAEPRPGADAPEPRHEPVVLVERQRLRTIARRTTGYNYVFTVPGDTLERLVLVAHYDTWRGPGADDNTTGEEILKQYLIEDLRAPTRPPLTHVYILAGSEECGLIGFASQVVLGLALGLANVALSHGLYAITALGLAIVPLAGFRFGVSGSREYVASLSASELALVKSVIAVDSVGEGRMYIPETALGASFVSAFFPYPGYEQLNHLLQEGAHLHGIKYNTFIAGGTTDHISFLEVGRRWRDRLGNLLGCPRWLGCHRQGKRRIPAAALVTLGPGKASPLVLGGKIHTPHDTADRVYPKPLGEALHILDYWLHLMQGGARIAEPRELDEYHYAQLFRVRRPGNAAAPRVREADPSDEHWLALKDAIEPNRRNLNGLYRVDVAIADGVARCQRPRIAAWGVDTRLAGELATQLPPDAVRERLPLRRLELAAGDGVIAFESRGRAVWHAVEAAGHDAVGALERLMGANTFLAFFGAAYLLAKLVEIALGLAFHWPAFQEQFFRYFAFTLPLTIVLQLGVVVWLVGKKIPTLIDNAYRHLNKADNLRSLRRVRA
jgi:peptidase M28-like protein